jgi:hypothetical protein
VQSPDDWIGNIKQVKQSSERLTACAMRGIVFTWGAAPPGNLRLTGGPYPCIKGIYGTCRRSSSTNRVVNTALSLHPTMTHDKFWKRCSGPRLLNLIIAVSALCISYEGMSQGIMGASLSPRILA